MAPTACLRRSTWARRLTARSRISTSRSDPRCNSSMWRTSRTNPLPKYLAFRSALCDRASSADGDRCSGRWVRTPGTQVFTRTLAEREVRGVSAMPDEIRSIDCNTAVSRLWDFLDEELDEQRMREIQKHLEECSD